jgi:hypothetical protein
MQLRRYDINDPRLVFPEGLKRNHTVDKYAEWIRQGSEPPPLTGLETEKGSIKIQEGHHRASAIKETGGDSVNVWVSVTQSVPIGKTEAGEVITSPRGVTHRDAVKQAVEQGQPVPQSVLGDYPDFGGFRASGGHVLSDKVHVVGENGPELFVPSTDGTIVPNHKLGMFTALMGGSTQRGMANAMQKFGGFRAEGGDVEGGKLHIVGEDGVELFLPMLSIGDLPQDELQGISQTAGRNFLPQLAKAIQSQAQSSAPGDSVSTPNALDKLAQANEIANDELAGKDRKPEAFNNRKAALRIAALSLPTPTESKADDLLDFASLALNTGGKLVGGSGSSDSGGFSTGGDSGNSSDSRSSSDQAGNSIGGLNLSSADQANLGDFQNSELSQLDNSNAGTYPDLGMDAAVDSMSAGDSNGGGSGGSSDSGGGTNWAALGLQLGAIGLGLLKKWIDRPIDRHRKQGNPYYIPNFNAALADGGTAKAGMMHLVGERGQELFVPHANGAMDLGSFAQFSSMQGGSTQTGITNLLNSHSYESAGLNLAPAVRMRDVMPFGGYRAEGGTVDPDYSYMVGENGPEMWTPPSRGGSIVPNDSLTGAGGKSGDVYIDARDSDPAAVERRVRTGMQAAHNAAVRTSFKSYVEYEKRSPQRIGGGR